MKQFQLTSRARHLRYIYFIDKNYQYSNLFELICSNQKMWGGRYNPIIPVEDNNISDKYISLLTNYDPDYIFYSNDVDPEIIKKLKFFNPKGYYNLDEEPRKEDISGVNAFYFLSRFDLSTKIILPGDIWKTKSILLDYYRINFGLESNSIFSDYEIGKNNPQIHINTENFNSLNKILTELKPINQSHLSRLNLNTRILRNLKEANYNDFEIIITKDKTATQDLIYYWNRLLFSGKNIIYITLEELNELVEDIFFGQVIYNMSSDDVIHIVSMTLSEDELEEIINDKLKKINSHRIFKYKEISSFPFTILDSNGLFERNYGEQPVVQTLVSENGILHLPKLSFTDKVGYYPQKWAVDIEIMEVANDFQNRIAFPFTTSVQNIVKSVDGRINKYRNISIFIHNQNTSNNLNIHIPEINSLLRQLIIYPIVFGEHTETPFVDIQLHDASNRLFAFLKSFNFDFSTIEDFFSDKFWFDIFKELIINDRVAGDSIHFEDIKLKSIETLKMVGIDLGKREETFRNEENLELGLKKTLEELCGYKVFLKGFNLKCQKCSSEFWYHIKEVSEIINCKGCFEDFELEIEPKFSYKLNDLIKNNVYQSKKSPDGNLTVIRTLASLNQRARYSFAYSPQLNIFNNFHSRKPYTDLDIICISDGKLFIGEAKHSSPAFFDKNKDGINSLDRLVEISKTILPDAIILSCYEDNNNKLDKARQYLEGKFYKYDYTPKIEIIHLSEPNYFQLGHHRYFYY